MTYVLFIPFFLQGFFILIDEVYFHQRRELPKWERIGHPIDTLSLIICIALVAFTTFNSTTLGWYMGLSLFSCLLITKDEWIHARECTGGENWIHSILFILHPLVLLAAGFMWVNDETRWLRFQFFLLLIYGTYQMIYWNLIKTKSNVNNLYYNDLGDRWYKANDDPIALLRSESKLFVDWIDTELRKKFSPDISTILDIGCGGGFLSNALAAKGWKITAVDMSQESLDIAKKYDSTKTVNYLHMNAEDLSFQNATFDAVISLDMLEHVEDPQKVISECSRVIKKNGLFFFHTFNRTFMGWLLAVKGIKWVFKNAPSHIHILRLFIKPSELILFCKNADLTVDYLTGVSPRFSRKFWIPLLLHGKVVDEFEFHFTTNTQVGYAGFATKQGRA